MTEEDEAARQYYLWCHNGTKCRYWADLDPRVKAEWIRRYNRLKADREKAIRAYACQKKAKE